MNFIKAYWGHILVTLTALAALGTAISGNDTAKQACFASPKCKAAYEQGLTPEQVSATTPTASIVTE